MKLVEHAMKAVESVRKRLCRIVTVTEMQFCFMPERAKIYTVFILRKLQEEYHNKWKKLNVRFVVLEKVFYGETRKVLE